MIAKKKRKVQEQGKNEAAICGAPAQAAWIPEASATRKGDDSIS